MIKKIAIAIASAIVAILVYAAFQPDSFRVQRSIEIKEAPEKIVAHIDNFRNWAAWSPWEHLDPAMTRSFAGAASGKGAIYSWTGNSEVGAGRMEITGQTMPSLVTIKLDFITPFEAHNTAEFLLEPRAGMTRVTWSMHGPSTYMTKLMTVFVSMDSMVGKDFEKGLAGLKAISEK